METPKIDLMEKLRKFNIDQIILQSLHNDIKEDCIGINKIFIVNEEYNKAGKELLKILNKIVDSRVNAFRVYLAKELNVLTEYNISKGSSSMFTENYDEILEYDDFIKDLEIKSCENFKEHLEVTNKLKSLKINHG